MWSVCQMHCVITWSHMYSFVEDPTLNGVSRCLWKPKLMLKVFKIPVPTAEKTHLYSAYRVCRFVRSVCRFMLDYTASLPGRHYSSLSSIKGHYVTSKRHFRWPIAATSYCRRAELSATPLWETSELKTRLSAVHKNHCTNQSFSCEVWPSW